MAEIFHFELQNKLKFNEIYQREALFRSALALYAKSLFFRRKARTTSWDGGTLYDFACNGSEELDRLHRELVNRQFAFSPAKPLKIFRSGKERTVYIWPWRERVVDLMLYQQMNQRLDRYFSRSVFAFRWHGYGIDLCQNRVARFIGKNRNGPVYVVKRDVSNCFPSLPHELLQEAVAAVTEPDDYLGRLLLDHIRFSYMLEADGEPITADAGVPFGAPTACLLANLALTPFDHALDGLPKSCYTRYADDMLFLTTDRETARKAVETFGAVFDRLGVASKAKAEVNGILTKDAGTVPAEPFAALPGLKHLGIYFQAGGTVSLALDKQRKICRMFRSSFIRCRRYLRRISDPRKRAARLCTAARNMLEKTQSQVAIIDYYLKHVTDTRQLQLLDRWLAEEVLSIALDTGHKKGNFAKISFKELREMGLPSLVHRRRLLLHRHIDNSFLRWKNALQG